MMVFVILVIIVGWLLLSVIASLGVAAIAQGGREEDRSRGYLVDHH